MTPTRDGSLRLFRFAGVNVYLHWSWFLLAAYEMMQRRQSYSSLVFNALEYLSLFGIVLLHEFGHSLACRQVGGRADQIVLWPLGGVAYVAPPQRPGAMLWSIAAGPLVNVVLLPVLVFVWWSSRELGWERSLPDAYKLVQSIAVINGALLTFNLLPVYPLDGGQILRSLLWFVCGRARSLMIAASFGFVGVAALGALALWLRSIWIGIMAGFVLLNCLAGLRLARQLAAVGRLPRRGGFTCPSCQMAPPVGALWLCNRCRQAVDTFASQGTCPQCGEQFPAAVCPDCGVSSPLSEWAASGGVPPKLG
jgi:Zn-dependent protease